jgi:hypothetical protein
MSTAKRRLLNAKMEVLGLDGLFEEKHCEGSAGGVGNWKKRSKECDC